MDIKLVKNFEEGNYIPVNEQLLLQVVDANYRLGRFPGQKIFMLNPLTNERKFINTIWQTSVMQQFPITIYCLHPQAVLMKHRWRFLTTVTMSVPVRIILSIPPWQT